MNQDSTSNKPSLAKLTKKDKKQEKENQIQAKEKSSQDKNKPT